MIDLRNFFLIREVKENYLEHSNGEISLGFRLRHKPYGITSPETKKNIFEFLNRLLRSWPEGTWLQKQDFFWERMVTPDNSKHYSDVSRENYKYYSMRYTLGHESFIYVTYIPEKFRNYTLNDSPFVRMVKQGINPPGKEMKAEIEAMIANITGELEKGVYGFSGKKLTTGQWEKVCYAFYSGDYNFDDWEVPEVLELGNYQHTPEGYLQRENVLFSNIFMGREPQQEVPLWDKYRVVSAKEEEGFVYLPNEEIENYSAFPITAGLPFAHCTTVTVQKASNELVIAEINKQMKLNTFGAGGGKQNPDNMDKEQKETTKAHAERLKSYIIDSAYPACSYGVTVTVPSHEKKALYEKTEMVKSAFSQYAAKGEFNKAHNMPLFFASAPAHGHNGHDLLIGQTVNALPFFNINSFKQGDHSGILYTDPTTGYPINFEPWDNPLLAGVRNGIVAGPTRGGKSVLVSNESDYYFNNGYHQVIIEKGKSFEWLAMIYDGDYIDLHPGSEIGIDIFEYDPGKMSELQKALIVSILSKIYPKSDENVIAGVTNIIEVYNQEMKQLGQNPSIESFYHYYVKEYMDSGSVYEKHIDLKLYEAELKRFVHGDNKWLFNNKESIKINQKPFVVFEMKSLEASPLYNLAFEAVLGLINRKMEYWDRAIKLVIKIDEVQQPFEDPNLSSIMKNYYTQVGKFNAGITIMVQGIDLINKLPAWDTIDSNTQMRSFTYNQHLSGWAEKQAKLLNWDSYRYKLVKNLRSTDRFREFMVIAGEEEMVFSLELSPIANFIFSTTAEVRKKIQKIKEENPNRSLKELIFEQYYRDKRKKTA